MQDTGYIALHRRVFAHPLFKNEKPFSRFHAWVWLISAAAWCQTQRRVKRKLVGLDRGQLATTTRDLAQTWGWPHGRTRRFIDALRREGMIRTISPGTATGTATGTDLRSAYTIITICNYSEFQDKSTGQDSKQAQKPAQKPKRGEQQQLDLEGEILPQESNHSTNKDIGKKIEGKVNRGRTKPRHGQRSFKKGTVWIDYDSSDYRVYADDFKSVTGADPIPQPYIGGKGRWFKILGEGSVPMARAVSAVRDQLEASHRIRRSAAK